MTGRPAPSIGSRISAAWHTEWTPRRRQKLRWIVHERLLRLMHWPGTRFLAQSGSAMAQNASTEWSVTDTAELPERMIDKALADNPQDIRVAPNRIRSTFEYQLVELQEAVMYTDGATHRSVYDSSGYRCGVLSHGAAPGRLPLPARERIAGSSLNAFGNIAMLGGNYGHWLLDGLSRVFMAERAGSLERFDHIVLPSLSMPFHAEMLELMGIELRKAVQLHPMRRLRFESLTASSAPRGSGSSLVPAWLVEGFRQRARDHLERADSRTRRIYVSRRDAAARNFSNEEEVVAALEGRGFETHALSEHDLAGKIRLFAEADCIVGLTGAGLVNNMFCAHGATMLELVSPILTNYAVASICSQRKMAYQAVPFEAREPIVATDRQGGRFELDLEPLVKRLDALNFR